MKHRARRSEEPTTAPEDPSAGWEPIRWDGSQLTAGPRRGDQLVDQRPDTAVVDHAPPTGAPAAAAPAPHPIPEIDPRPPRSDSPPDEQPSTWSALADPAATGPQPLAPATDTPAAPSGAAAAASPPPPTLAPAPLPTIAASTATDLVAAVEALVLRLRELSTHKKAIGRRGDLRALGVAAYQRAQLLKLELAESGALPASAPPTPTPRPGAVVAFAPTDPSAAEQPGATGPAPAAPKLSRRARRRARRAEGQTTERVAAVEPAAAEGPGGDPMSASPPGATTPPPPPAQLSWRARRRARRAERHAGAAASA